MEQLKKTSTTKTTYIHICIYLVKELCFAKYFSSDKKKSYFDLQLNVPLFSLLTAGLWNSARRKLWKINISSVSHEIPFVYVPGTGVVSFPSVSKAVAACQNNNRTKARTPQLNNQQHLLQQELWAENLPYRRAGRESKTTFPPLQTFFLRCVARLQGLVISSEGTTWTKHFSPISVDAEAQRELLQPFHKGTRRPEYTFPP